MLRIKEGFVLKKMMDAYMIICIGDNADSYKDIIQINETGEFLWRMLEKGTTPEKMAAAMVGRFEDLDEDTAREDIMEFLDNIDAVLIKE